MVAAIIVGAGEGRRMGARGRKQFVKIAGRPLIAYTIEVFEQSALVDHIVVVVPRDSVDWVKEEIIEAYGFKKVHAVVYGGETRQQSVFNGLRAVKQGTTAVLIHDAVRPLISETLITRVLDASHKSGAAITAVPARDTVKRVESGDIVGTLDRRLLWFAQTPQGFRYDTIMNAHTKAAAENFEATDDAALLEKYGTRVAVAVGSYSNIKITSPEDLPMFEYFLAPEVRTRIDSAVHAGAVAQAGPGRSGGPGQHGGQRPSGRGGAGRHRGPRGPRRSERHVGVPAEAGAALAVPRTADSYGPGARTPSHMHVPAGTRAPAHAQPPSAHHGPGGPRDVPGHHRGGGHFGGHQVHGAPGVPSGQRGQGPPGQTPHRGRRHRRRRSGRH